MAFLCDPRLWLRSLPSGRKRKESFIALAVLFTLGIVCLVEEGGIPRYLGADADWPEIAWLMTFPNSGTSFTSTLVQTAGFVTTATNFGNEVGMAGIDYLDNPEFSHGASGPFRSTTRRMPGSFILTKTHCGGFDSPGSPATAIKTVPMFVKRCARGVKQRVGRKDGERPNVGVMYDPKIVKRAVHLIRNPLDNIVARFHFVASQHIPNVGRAKDTADYLVLPDDEWSYARDSDGFGQWCRDMNDRFDPVKFYDKRVANLAKRVPCAGHFYQYVKWHNNAFGACEQLDIPAHIVHYEDYHLDKQWTYHKLLNFLGERRVGNAYPFKWNGGYEDHYTKEERDAIMEFIKLVASEETYASLERYFIDK